MGVKHDVKATVNIRQQREPEEGAFHVQVHTNKNISHEIFTV